MNSAFKISLLFIYLFCLVQKTEQMEKEMKCNFKTLETWYNKVQNFIPNSLQDEGVDNHLMIPSYYYQKNIFSILEPEFRELRNLGSNRDKLINQYQQAINKNGNNAGNITELTNHIKQIDMVTKNMSNRLSLLSRIDPFHEIKRRYNNIDSYFWNSLMIDLNEKFFSNKHSLYPDYSLYPASKVKLPVWKSVGSSLNLDFPESIDEHEFLIMSAPVHKDLEISQKNEILKKLNLTTHDEIGHTLVDNQNMIYFFKSIIQDNINTVIAICSDGELQKIPDPARSNKILVTDKPNVVAKCQMYWHASFEIITPSSKIQIVSTKLKDESTTLYNVYNLKIKDMDTLEERNVKVYVLFKWPDHEKLPEDMLSDYMKLLELMNQTLQANRNNSQIEKNTRIGVHCSAGVGRTGTLILSYQIYSQLKELAQIQNLSSSTTFYEIVQDYQPSARFQRFLYQNMADGSHDMKSSKLLAYLLDNLMYHRINRMYFVQTYDQFYFMVFFAGQISMDWVLSSQKPVLEYPNNNPAKNLKNNSASEKKGNIISHKVLL